jgi:hypothetical protein
MSTSGLRYNLFLVDNINVLFMKTFKTSETRATQSVVYPLT